MLPPLVSIALNRYGLNGTFLIMAGVTLNVCVCGMLFRPATFYMSRYRLKRARQCRPMCNGGMRADRLVVSIIRVDTHDTNLAHQNENNVKPVNNTSELYSKDQELHRRKKPAFDWDVLRSPLLYLYAMSECIADSSFTNIYNMLPSHAQQLGVSKTNSVLIISIIGAGDLVSRMCIGGFADVNLFRKRHIYQVRCLLAPL